MQTVSNVDINRFMGDWYVVAGIPTWPEKGAINPIEQYALNADGTINTTFNYIKDGKQKSLNATGFVREETGNAIWGMQFIWPIKADYRIVYLDPKYDVTIIARQKRDYLWIMSRSAPIEDSLLQQLIDFTVELGYDESDIIKFNWQTDHDVREAG